MNEEVPLETLLELGDRKLAQGEPDRALHYYNQALKKSLDDPRVNFKLAEAYLLKGDRDGKVYYTLGMEPLRRILKAAPRDEAAHEKLMVMAVRAGTLDVLTQEYGEKAKAEPGDEFYAKFLKRAYALSLLDVDLKPALPEYTPSPYIKHFFDLFILPLGALTLVISNLGIKYRPFFALGLAMFLFYCAYRGILFMLLRKR